MFQLRDILDTQQGGSPMLQDATDFERYFRDPKVGDGVLGPGSIGVACKNIRLALRFLDLHDGIGFPETYDDELANSVLRFQEVEKHSSRDGQFGPGTRRLLTRTLLEKMGEGSFKRMSDPERRDRGQVFVSYARVDSSPVRDIVELMRVWGFTVWYDDSISGSEHFNVSIQQAIEDCYLQVVCLTEASVQSDWVIKEVMFANQSKKEILPVRMRALPPVHSLKLVLVNHQTLDTDDANFAERLKAAVKGAQVRAFDN
jgi:hypothetical protein